MKNLIASIMILGMVGMIVGVAVKATSHEASVGATVTVQNISVSVTDGNVAYGTIAAGDSADTLTPADAQTATNDGNVTATLNIRGTDLSTGAGTTWTLAATATGVTEYRHAFSTDAFVSVDTALTLNNQTLAAGVIAGDSQTFDLKITTPPSATDFTEQSVNVIVQATI